MFVFSDKQLDDLEAGNMREMPDDQLMKSVINCQNQSRMATLEESYSLACFIRRENKKKFWLFADSDVDRAEFLLSAFYDEHEESFFISRYYEFPNERESIQHKVDYSFFNPLESLDHRYSWCFRLDSESSGKEFTLFSKFCSKFGNKSSFRDPEKQLTGRNQELAKIQHCTSKVSTNFCDVDCNAIKVAIPLLTKELTPDVQVEEKEPHKPAKNLYKRRDKKSRDKENSSSQSSKNLTSVPFNSTKDMKIVSKGWEPDSEPAKPIETWQSNLVNFNDSSQQIKKEQICLESKKPRYDELTNSLKMKFTNEGIRIPSSKNVLLETINPLTNEAVNVLQFGKCSQDRYVLDIGHPLNLVQGFAIALSLFQWLRKQ